MGTAYFAVPVLVCHWRSSITTWSISPFFPQLLPDGFENVDHIADITMGVLQPHIHNAAVIGNTVKLSVNFHPSFPEHFSDIPEENNICATFVWDFMEECVIFKSLRDYRDKSTSPKT